MMKKRIAAGLLSAVLLITAPGLLQSAYAADGQSSGASYSADAVDAKSFTVKVTASQLNIRKSASNTSAITGLLKKGNVVTITAEQMDTRGVTWGKLSNGKGWINLDYTTKTSNTKFDQYKAEVTASQLNIRKYANNSSVITGVLKKGNVVTIVDEMIDSRGVTWGKLSTGKGWINLSYTKDPSAVKYTVTVMASQLNIRKSASNTSDITGLLKLNNKVTIVSESTDKRGVTWGKLSDGRGWINLNYTMKAGCVKSSVKVTASSLTIRLGPSGAYTANGTLAKGKIISIMEIVTANGNQWGKLSNGKGWICLKYTTKV